MRFGSKNGSLTSGTWTGYETQHLSTWQANEKIDYKALRSWDRLRQTTSALVWLSLKGCQMISRQTESISGRDNRMANQVLIRINDCGTKFATGVPDTRRTNTKAFCYKRGIHPIKAIHKSKWSASIWRSERRKWNRSTTFRHLLGNDSR